MEMILFTTSPLSHAHQTILASLDEREKIVFPQDSCSIPPRYPLPKQRCSSWNPGVANGQYSDREEAKFNTNHSNLASQSEGQVFLSTYT